MHPHPFVTVSPFLSATRFIETPRQTLGRLNNYFEALCVFVYDIPFCFCLGGGFTICQWRRGFCFSVTGEVLQLIITGYFFELLEADVFELNDVVLG